MNKIVQYILISFFAFSYACSEEFLNQEVKGEFTDDILDNSLVISQQYINGVYASRDREEGKHLNARAIDMLATPYFAAPSFGADIDIHSLSSSSNIVRDVWQLNFRYIRRANTLIESLNKLEDETTDGAGYIIKNRLKGEAKFLRALRSYFLVKAFGNVPLTRETIAPDEYKNIPQLSQAEGWQFIINDLIAASYGDEKLPLKSEWPADQLGRATEGAAKSLLAKVYLEAGEYELARSTAQEVIESGEYSLYANKFGDWGNYYNIFRMAQENGPGSIFEWQQSVTVGHLLATEYNRDMSPTDNTKLSTYTGDRVVSELWDTVDYHGSKALMKDTLKWGDIVPADAISVKFIIDWQEGSGSIQPTQYLKQIFESEEATDPRKFITIIEHGSFYPDFGLFWTENSYTGLFFGKTVGTRAEKENNVSWWWGKNISVIRYADLLLTYAEATALTGSNLDDAVTKINMVRERAGNESYPIALRHLTGLNQSQVLEWVRTERLLELSGEGGEFFDMQRYAQHHPGWQWNDYMENEDVRARGNFIPEKHSLFPIPQREIDLAGLLQNPGY